ncbi:MULTISPECIES: bacillithiol biosynthesis cysteine-adding enzyme BshC [Bacillus]|uniref:bacillithiol biosynthesis cysteine-adding enzyme BshC n=1 Tax=Bacillus TaxID=1386 RepID=UPI000311E84F|nr:MULTISPECIES: bacillithiol biosynthesis cysteine-adding enzyme BshC [Bacillus]
MEIKEIVLPSINKFASNYLKDLSHANTYFHYDLKEVNMYNHRYNDVMKQSFNREKLAQAIENYIRKFGISTEVRNNLERLQQHDSVVVIGGQQAGLLTGPTYTIHKVISIIKLAKQQEELLNKPVIPVFWIAGEDHDLDEVNHVFVEKEGHFEKKTYGSTVQTKANISDTPLEEGSFDKWLEEVFSSFEETAYTKELYHELKDYSKRSSNFTDFFSFIINELFNKYGLLLIDSADQNFRRLQGEFFETLITRHSEINEAVRSQQTFIMENGYNTVIAMDNQNANLFYYDNEERVLLEYDNNRQLFCGKNSSIHFTKDELLNIARNEPWKLSNNVVTRPMMQEYLFPVLGFISGPGEIAYWAELKKAFELLEMKLPPIVPRMNITILEPKIKKDLLDVDMDIYEALVAGTSEARNRFIATVEDPQMILLYENMQKQFKESHQLLSQSALSVDRGLEPLLKKNAEIIENQIQFLYKKIQQSIEKNHTQTLQAFMRIENALRPNGGPQERLINIYYFVNKYGLHFIDDLMALNFESNNFHKIVVM